MKYSINDTFRSKQNNLIYKITRIFKDTYFIETIKLLEGHTINENLLEKNYTPVKLKQGTTIQLTLF
jgi:hypothetical protein